MPTVGQKWYYEQSQFFITFYRCNLYIPPLVFYSLQLLLKKRERKEEERMYRHETNKINLITERRNSSTSLIVPSPLLLEGKKYTILSKLLYTIFIFTRHVRKGKRVYIYIYNIRERERNMYGRENNVPMKGRNS